MRRWIARIIIPVFILGAAAGCVSGTLAKGEKSELAEILKAAAKDSGTWCMTVNLMTPWGSEQSSLSRTNLASGTVICDSKGLTLRPEPGQ